MDARTALSALLSLIVLSGSLRAQEPPDGPLDARLAQRLREAQERGDLSRERLVLAAYLGSEPARLALEPSPAAAGQPPEAQEDSRDLLTWLAGLQARVHDGQTALRVLLAAARVTRSLVRDHAAAKQCVEATEEWLVSPSPELAAAVAQAGEAARLDARRLGGQEPGLLAKYQALTVVAMLAEQVGHLQRKAERRAWSGLLLSALDVAFEAQVNATAAEALARVPKDPPVDPERFAEAYDRLLAEAGRRALGKLQRALRDEVIPWLLRKSDPVQERVRIRHTPFESCEPPDHDSR